jgi:hypothetical protein
MIAFYMDNCGNSNASCLGTVWQMLKKNSQYGISHQTLPVTLITFRNPGLKIMKTEKIFVAVWGLMIS